MFILIELDKYIEKYKLRNTEVVKKLIINNSLLDAEIKNDVYYVADYIWKVDTRRIPKKLSSIYIRASIIQAINDRFHLDYKMIKIEKKHFIEYLSMLREIGIIRLVKDNNPQRVESYIIGDKIPTEVISKRKKLLGYIDKKFDALLSKATETAVIAAINKNG